MNDTHTHTPTVSINGLTKNYDTPAGSVQVLRDVNLKLYPGEMVAIMGPSGCGKSTMLYILGLLTLPSTGKYTIMGQDMFGLDKHQQASYRREYLGFILQSCNLFEHSTVYENLEYPLIYSRCPVSNRRKIIEEALDKVNLMHRVTFPTNQLSGGEQQRVAIARALVNNPKVLLGDEPTGQLDSKTSEMVMSYFKQIIAEHDTTMLIVTHDVTVAKHCTRAFQMREGVLEPAVFEKGV
ncbi:MAG TPA: ABC transporter ATP-binding protein [Humidesulfovibrio sp.]|uniref:ABC transporter ATP-binding protein n=1 Tax=Humidesulfovibrio sp. TaxID=2910988 RepID=UPI002D023AE0|nr:ABC transporter ATP-binding protein [Humidesulfovibrio sp.]HWR04158.1 ABC transporter ATP-binding protein [Humidesulfovibrio sp.]